MKLSPAIRLVRVLAVGAFVAAGISACSSGIFANSKKAKEEQRAEEADGRISILTYEETLTADPRYAGVSVELPPSYKNASWPQPGGEADHTLHHLSGPQSLKTAWNADVGKVSKRRARLTSPPVVADGRVYVSDAAATVSAFNAETGAEIWSTELAPEIDEKFRVRDIFARTKPEQVGFGGGVAYDSGLVFVTSGFSFVAALDAETGEERWKFETEAPVRTPPTAYRGAVYFVTISNEMIALDASTGEQQWNYQSFEESARILSSASPAAAGDLIVAPFSSGEVVAFLTGQGRAVWNDTLSRNSSLTSLSLLNDIAGSPVIDRGLVYVVSHAGKLTAIDIRSGQRVWEVPMASLQMPWVAGDFIFLVSVDGELTCVSREDGGIVWVSQLRRYKNEKKKKGRIAWAGPVAVGDHLILVSSEGDLVKASPADGEIVEEREIGEGSVVPPVVAEETLFVLTENGKLLAIR